MAYFTEEDPPALTEAQAEAILEVVKNGARVQRITLHPYSGAATLSSTWKRSGGETIAIVNQGGGFSYVGKDISMPDWIYRPDAA